MVMMKDILLSSGGIKFWLARSVLEKGGQTSGSFGLFLSFFLRGNCEKFLVTLRLMEAEKNRQFLNIVVKTSLKNFYFVEN